MKSHGIWSAAVCALLAIPASVRGDDDDRDDWRERYGRQAERLREAEKERAEAYREWLKDERERDRKDWEERRKAEEKYRERLQKEQERQWRSDRGFPPGRALGLGRRYDDGQLGYDYRYREEPRDGQRSYEYGGHPYHAPSYEPRSYYEPPHSYDAYGYPRGYGQGYELRLDRADVYVPPPPAYAAPPVYDPTYGAYYQPREGVRTGASIGARIGGALGGPEGARIGASIGADIGAEVDRR